MPIMSFREFLEEKECPQISKAEMDHFEKAVDALFKKFDIDFDFSKHFRERMGDSRNNPCINLKEIGQLITKLYREKAKGSKIINKMAGLEAVLTDISTDINIPVAIEYDRRKDEIRVGVKTVMRKKNFSTPDAKIRL